MQKFRQLEDIYDPAQFALQDVMDPKSVPECINDYAMLCRSFRADMIDASQ